MTLQLPSMARASSLADETAAAEETPVFVQAIDDGAGLVVQVLDTVLFFPVARTDVSVAAPGPVTDVASAKAALAALEASSGEELENLSLSFTVPSDEVSADEAAALERALTSAIVPTSPKGTRRLSVTRGDAYEVGASGGGIPFVALWLLLGAVFFLSLIHI